MEIETYQPNAKQQIFHRSPARYRLFGGAAGPGKSRALLEEACLQALEVPGATTLLLRRTYEELEASLISQFRQHILPKWVNAKGFSYNRSEHKVFWPNGSVTRFGYCKHEDDVYQYQGGEYLFIGVDELTMFTLKQWLFLTSRNRCPVADSFPNMAGATNPGNIGHAWVKSLWIEKKVPAEFDAVAAGKYKPEDYDFIRARIEDNPIYANDEAYLNALEMLPLHLRRMFREGDWDVFAGQYFAEFDKECTEIDHDAFLRLWGQQSWQPIWISLDWGSTHHAYAAWHTFVTVPVDYEAPIIEPDLSRAGRQAVIAAERSGAPGWQPPQKNLIVTFREYLCSGLGEEAWAEEIVRRTPQSERRRVNHIFLSPDTGFESELQRGYRIGSVFTQRQMPRAQAACNTKNGVRGRIDGWRLMYDKLRERLVSRGLMYSAWCISKNCPLGLSAIPWAVADPDHDGDIIKDGDAPELDVLDGLRYGIASYEYPEEKPASERMREVLAPLPVEGSSRFMTAKQFEVNEKSAKSGVYLGSLPHRGRRHGRS